MLLRTHCLDVLRVENELLGGQVLSGLREAGSQALTQLHLGKEQSSAHFLPLIAAAIPTATDN